MVLGLIYTILTGLFFLIGILLLKHNHFEEKISLFVFSLAFIVMGGLIFLDILPELIETKDIKLLIPVIIGFLALVLIDKLIPHHHHEHNHCDVHDHEEHLNHVGIITIIAISIHNMLEGLTLYSITLNNYLSGFVMMLSVSLHNIPLGLQIGNSLNGKKYSPYLIILLVLSSFIGALILIIFGNFNENIIHILLSFTLGMLIYILFFELFNEIRNSLKKKEVLYGIMVGVVILVITLIV